MEADIASIGRLVEQWRRRAESLRVAVGAEGAVGAARAEILDACAAQLSQLLPPGWIATVPRDDKTLELFPEGSPAESVVADR